MKERRNEGVEAQFQIPVGFQRVPESGGKKRWSVRRPGHRVGVMMVRTEEVSRSRKPGKQTRKKGPVEFEESQGQRFLGSPREWPLARTHLFLVQTVCLLFT